MYCLHARASLPGINLNFAKTDKVTSPIIYDNRNSFPFYTTYIYFVDTIFVNPLQSSVGFTKAACQRYQFMDEILWKLLGKYYRYYIAVKILQMCKLLGIVNIIISVTFSNATPYKRRRKKLIMLSAR